MNSKRYELLDVLRGLSIISMVLYHAVWDLVNVFQVSLPWYDGFIGQIWQQSICITFILVSGFCWNIGRRKFKRGITVFVCGGVITAVTLFVMPESRIIFGILTCIGSCMLLLIPMDKILRKLPSAVGILFSFLCFLLTYEINEGRISLFGNLLIPMPKNWYQQGMGMTYLGFMQEGFFSTDYFSIFPWIFLYLTGYFLYHFLKDHDWMCMLKWKRQKLLPIQWIGRHSLWIYMLHQPLVYGALYIVFKY